MGYFSDLRVAVTKRDYLTMLDKNKQSSIKCNFLLEPNDAYIKEYEENGVNCVLIQQFDLKYYKEFEDVQQFEKYLKEAKSGYVFLRIGGRWNDIEYRNTAKYKELEVPFKFIKSIKEKANQELLSELNSESKYYKVTSKQFTITEERDLLEYYGDDKKIKALIEEKYNSNVQVKLVLDINTINNETKVTLYFREPKKEKYVEFKTEYPDMNQTLLFLGYPNKSAFLKDINERKVSKIREEEQEFE